jgi:hypothetical protein
MANLRHSNHHMHERFLESQASHPPIKTQYSFVGNPPSAPLINPSGKMKRNEQILARLATSLAFIYPANGSADI